MSSIFSSIQPSEPDEIPPEAPDTTAPSVEPLGVEAPIAMAAEVASSQLTSIDQVPAAIVDALDNFLPPIQAGLPDPGIIVLNITDKTLGLGNLRGLDARGIFPAVELLGGHAEAVVRFQLFGSTPTQVNAEMLALQGRLMAARADLWDLGFLEMTGISGQLPSQAAPGSPWERFADYQILYEYHLVPTAGADSLIARIPIHADPEVRNSLARETSTVTDEMARWDDQNAPTLVVRGIGTIRRFSLLSFIPGADPSGVVTLTRTHDGASGAPNVYPSLGDFLNALADPVNPERHGQFIFASIADFLAGFTTAGDPFPLGDWDEDSLPDTYQSLELALDPPVHLSRSIDMLQVSPGVSPLDQAAVIYLRALTMS